MVHGSLLDNGSWFTINGYFEYLRIWHGIKISLRRSHSIRRQKRLSSIRSVGNCHLWWRKKTSTKWAYMSCRMILLVVLLVCISISRRMRNIGVFYKLVFMFLSGCLFCLADFGLSFASVSFSFSHDARIAPSFIKDICSMMASKSPQANL